MRRNVSTTEAGSGRLTSWLRKSYPKAAPEHGHNYLIALCSMDCSAR